MIWLKKRERKKVCLISSSGGHFEQLLMLRKLSDDYDTFIVTEKTKYNKKDKKIDHYISQVNRKEILFIFKMLLITIKSLFIYLREKPDVILTGFSAYPYTIDFAKIKEICDEVHCYMMVDMA